MKGIAAILLTLVMFTPAGAAWRVGPRNIFRAPQVRQPVRLVQRPAFAQPIRQQGCRMVNGRLVCPNAR